VKSAIVKSTSCPTADLLLVEGPKVLDRTSAPSDDEDLDLGQAAQDPDALGDLVGRAFALDPDGMDEDVEAGVTPVENAEDIAEGGAGR
jgi:hypothetical protein